MASRGKIWSTKKINESISRIDNGDPAADYSPFYDGDTQYRAADIVFEYVGSIGFIGSFFTGTQSTAATATSSSSTMLPTNASTAPIPPQYIKNLVNKNHRHKPEIEFSFEVRFPDVI